MKYIIRNSRGEYWNGKRVEQTNRFHRALIFVPDREAAAEVEEAEKDAVLADPKCPPGASAEPV